MGELLLCLAALIGGDTPQLAITKNDWAGFQGPIHRQNAEGQLPIEWSQSKNLAWSAPISGYGQSSPVVWDGQIYVASTAGPMKETYSVAAFRLADGKQIWLREFKAASTAENTGYISKASPTPVVDPSGVVAFSECGNLVALGHDGTIRWQRNLVEEFGDVASRHGLGSSLVQTSDLAFVWVERQKLPYLRAVEKSSGKDRWKIDGLGQATWSTPAIIPIADQQHLVLSGSGVIAGVDLETGKQLWTLKGLAGNTIPTPQPAGANRFLLGASEGRGEARENGAANCNGLVEVVRGENGAFDARFVWRAGKATSSFGSPIVHEGLAYFVNAAGVLYCLDLESGQEKYAHRIAESIWATPLAMSDRIYFFGKTGRTTVVKPGSAFVQLALNRLWTDEDEKQPAAAEKPAAAGAGQVAPSTPSAHVQYAAIVVDRSLIIRSGDELVCLRSE